MYLQGLETFRLLTDHKPLVPLINTKPLDQVPIRCQRLLMRMMRFNPVAEHVPGKSMVIADTLSWSPLPVIEERSIEELHSEVEATVNSIISSIASPNKLMEIRIATWEDTILQRVLNFILHQTWLAKVRERCGRRASRISPHSECYLWSKWLT